MLIGDEAALPVLICSQYRRFSRASHDRMLKGHSRRSFAHEARQAAHNSSGKRTLKRSKTSRTSVAMAGKCKSVTASPCMQWL